MALCRVAKWLESELVCSRLASEQWALDLGYRPLVAKNAAKANFDRLARFKARVPAVWSKPGEAAPEEPELLNLRVVLREVRDTRLAHLLTRAPKNDPTYDQIRRFLDLTLELSTDLAFVLLGSELGTARFKTFADEEAVKLWSMILRSPVETYRQDKSHLDQTSVGFTEELD